MRRTQAEFTLRARLSAEERVRKEGAAAQRLTYISSVATDGPFTQQEAEAVLAHIFSSEPYQKNTLLALQALNRYAREKGIRVEDAITVIQEWVPHHTPLTISKETMKEGKK